MNFSKMFSRDRKKSIKTAARFGRVRQMEFDLLEKRDVPAGTLVGWDFSTFTTGIVGAAPIWHQFMTTALQAVPNEWYPTPSGLDQIGNNYFLPGTENLRSALAAPWPVCPFPSSSVGGVEILFPVPEPRNPTFRWQTISILAGKLDAIWTKDRQR